MTSDDTSTGSPDPAQATVTAALLRLQHRKGWLSDNDMRELAARLDVPIFKLEEVVSFFPHFRRTPPPLVEVSVCRDMTCHLRGADAITKHLQNSCANDKRIEVKQVSCLGRCDRAVAVVVNRYAESNKQECDDVHDALYVKRDKAELAEIVAEIAAGKPAPFPDLDANFPVNAATPWQIDVYNGTPTYEATKRYLRELRAADSLAEARVKLDIIPKVELAGLRGMGGAGAPTAKKWKDVRQAPGNEKYIVCNADESEPATFKDRELMLRSPYLVVEGVILAGIAIGATRGYIYLRHEYPEQAATLREAIAAAERQRVCGTNIGGTGIDFPVSVFISPGGYICGEQSALIEAMEGKRAQPRNRPPELATNGLFDKPTLVNNVETFSWVPGIVMKTVIDADKSKQVNWYGEKAPDKKRGMRFFSISGDVNKPGAYEVPIGAPLRTLIEAAGGVVGGEARLLAVATSGPSGGFLPARLPTDPKDPSKGIPLLDIELDIDVYRKYKIALGAGLVVYAGNVDMLSQAINATEFYRNESCGKCVPCRVGSQKLVEIGLKIRELPSKTPVTLSPLRAAVRDLDRALEQTSICGLGQVAPKPLATLLQYFEPYSKRRAVSMMEIDLG